MEATTSPSQTDNRTDPLALLPLSLTTNKDYEDLGSVYEPAFCLLSLMSVVAFPPLYPFLVPLPSSL